MSGLSISTIFTSTLVPAIFSTDWLIFSISRPFFPIRTPGLEVFITKFILSEGLSIITEPMPQWE